MHPNKIKSRFFKTAVRDYLSKLGDATSDERKERMDELVNESVEAIEYAFDELEADIEYNPMKFLGAFEIYPDTLNSVLTTVLTLGFALMQSNFIDPVVK